MRENKFWNVVFIPMDRFLLRVEPTFHKIAYDKVEL